MVRVGNGPTSGSSSETPAAGRALSCPRVAEKIQSNVPLADGDSPRVASGREIELLFCESCCYATHHPIEIARLPPWGLLGRA